MGVVYRAHDPRIDRTIVIKTLRRDMIPPSDLPEYMARFYREAQAAGILSHPGIVGLHDVGEDEETGEPYLAMEYVPGTSLQAVVSAGVALPPAQVAEIIADVADALYFAHGNGVVHRDIKPANLFLGEGNRVKIGDFGVARVGGSTLTATGQTLGTPNYMSPEQLLGDPMDGRSDLFSLGVVAYQLLSRESPFAGKDFNSVAHKIVNHAPDPPHVKDAAIPEALSAAVMKALGKRPDDRFGSGREMAEAFRKAAGIRRSVTGSIPAVMPPADAAPRPPAPERRGTSPRPTMTDESTIAEPTRAATPAEATVLKGAQAPETLTQAPRGPILPALAIGILASAVLVLGIGLGIVMVLALRSPSAPPPEPMELLSQGRYEEAEAVALERLRQNPDDAEARVYLELARKALHGAKAPPRRAAATVPLPVPKPSRLEIDLTASWSGKLTVLVDGVVVLEETFTAHATRFFGRVVPGTVRPARESYSTVVSAGLHTLTVRAESRSGRTRLEDSIDVELPVDGGVSLEVTATERLRVAVR